MNPILLLPLVMASTVVGANTPTSARATIRVQPNQITCHLSRWLVGSCIEDVNHEIYGGLYAQRIFGESFEESPGSPLSNWTAYGGDWRLINGALSVAPNPGAKLVRNHLLLKNGTVSCELRFPNNKGDNAGLILRVSNPRTGADTWTGYEVSLSVKNQALILGSHRNNWQPLQTVPVKLQPNHWYKLQVRIEGSVLQVFIGDSPTALVVFDDGANAIRSGQVGLRTWNSGVEFRNLTVSTEGRTTSDTLSSPDPTKKQLQVSGMWDALVSSNANGRLLWDTHNPYNSQHSQSIDYTSGTGIVGVYNRGLNRWGIAVRKGSVMDGHIYVRGSSGDTSLTVALQSRNGKRTYAIERLPRASTSWTRQNFRLVPNGTDADSRFALWLSKPGKVNVDQVYLANTGTALFHRGPFRADIGNMLQEEGLTFLRYGGSMVNSPQYRWMNMIGPRDKRPQYNGTWYPYSTNGFAIPEFLQFCEDAHIKPAFAINIDETTKDAGNMVRYLNGSVRTYWGAKRASDGHPSPYNVAYIEIGNDEAINGDPNWYRHYLTRFERLYAVMHAADPKLQFIIAAWWRPHSPWCERIAKALNGKAALWDLHVDADHLHDADRVNSTLTEMQRQFHKWMPGTTMRACILEENGGRHDLQRALGHARILNVVMRHGDFVRIDCPANCLQPYRENDNGWDQGQVFFTPDKAWGMPPYYAQQMAAMNREPLCVKSRLMSPNNDLDVTATRSEDGKTLVLQVVNSGAVPHTTDVVISDFVPAGLMNTWTLTGELNAVNTPRQPRSITWHAARARVPAARFHYTFLPYSYTILRLHGRQTPGHTAGRRK